MKENRTGVREGDSVRTNRIITTGGSMAPGLDRNSAYTYKPTTSVPKHTEAEMKQLRTLAREA